MNVLEVQSQNNSQQQKFDPKLPITRESGMSGPDRKSVPVSTHT